MTKVVNPWHFLDEDGGFPDDPAARSRAIRIAQCIEYGGNLQRGHSRETLIQCRRRPDGAACPGLLHVLKQKDDAILVFCVICEVDEYLIYEWEDTLWAEGQMEPIDIDELARAHQESPRPEPTSRDPDELLARTLTLLGSPLPAAQVRKLIATAPNPMSIMEVVLASLPTPPLKGALERFLPVVMDLWNATPRQELGGFAPNEVHTHTAPRTSTKIGANTPCSCGSGKKYKRCCMNKQPLN
jgi:hypothetical protein